MPKVPIQPGSAIPKQQYNERLINWRNITTVCIKTNINLRHHHKLQQLSKDAAIKKKLERKQS